MKPFGLFHSLKNNVALGLSQPLERSLNQLFSQELPTRQSGPLNLLDPNGQISPEKIKTLVQTLQLSVQESRTLSERFMTKKETESKHNLKAHRGNRDTDCDECHRYENDLKTLQPPSQRKCALILPTNWHRPSDVSYFSIRNHVKRIFIGPDQDSDSDFFLGVSDKKNFADFFQIGPKGLRIYGQFRSFDFGVHESDNPSRSAALNANPRFDLSTMIKGALEYYKKGEKISAWQQLGGALQVRSLDGRSVALTPQSPIETVIQSLRKPVEVTSSKRLNPHPFLKEDHPAVPLLKICIEDLGLRSSSYRNYSCGITLYSPS